MTSPFTIECSATFSTRGRGSRKRPDQGSLVKAARVPRISRLMALAIRFSEMIRSGQVTTYAEFAGLGGVTPARMTQVMSLLSLAPDIQEEILFLQQTAKGRDQVQLRHVLSIAAIADWRNQRRTWKSTISHSEC